MLSAELQVHQEDLSEGLRVLVIDDVHFLAGKKATQEEFLHTFNSIEAMGRQVVMASDNHPKMIEEFAEGRGVTKPPFPRIPYDQAMLEFGSDKPDLRNPIILADVTDVFRGSGFGVFARSIENGGVVRGIPAPGAAGRPS